MAFTLAIHLQETKLLLRKDFVDHWMGYLEFEAENAWNLLSAPDTMKTLGKVLERLAGKPTQTKAAAKL